MQCSMFQKYYILQMKAPDFLQFQMLKPLRGFLAFYGHFVDALLILWGSKTQSRNKEATKFFGVLKFDADHKIKLKIKYCHKRE